ncbi:hypothetical protein Acr_10g0001370 [Actinidia rufa]|uniref:SHSP domain-containing protein n=1 Tax=Actinidia rufa TaxID=165716 RepID=A0A7J0F7R7_9ERIC|nr:hypothetical protein Acr_10g0001370 [Actinidia rufa]
MRSGSTNGAASREVYRIPEDCSIRGIHDKLEGGTLTITMPKKTSVAQVGKENPPKQQMLLRALKNKQRCQSPRNSKSDSGSKEKLRLNPSPKKGRGETPPIPTSCTNAATVVQKTTSTIGVSKQQTDGKGLEELTTQKTTANPSPKRVEAKLLQYQLHVQTLQRLFKRQHQPSRGQTNKPMVRALDEPTTQKTTEEPKSQKGRSETPPVPTSSTNAATVVQKTTSTIGEAKSQTNGKGLEEPTSQKAVAETMSKRVEVKLLRYNFKYQCCNGVQKTTSHRRANNKRWEGLEEPTYQKAAAETMSKGEVKPSVPTSSTNAATVFKDNINHRDCLKEKEKGKESIEPENFMKTILDKEKEESEESTAGTHKEEAKDYSDVSKSKQNRGVSFGLLSWET